MLYILFMLLVASLLALYLYSDKKIALLKKQLMITSNQYKNIKNKHDYYKGSIKDVSIKFITPDCTTGIINSGSTIYISPLLPSQVIRKIDIHMEVNILDTVEVNSEKWYYVNLPVNTNINCRGWINSKFISLLCNNQYSTIQNKLQ